MEEHSFLCACSRCNYERVLRQVKERYDLQSEKINIEFINGTDPFPPNSTKNKRFNYQGPRYQQEPRKPKEDWARHRPSKIGKFRRIKDNAFDVINFQYQPWPTAEWETYYSITFEVIQRQEERGINQRLAAMDWILQADKSLRENRFYKVERVDSPA